MVLTDGTRRLQNLTPLRHARHAAAARNPEQALAISAQIASVPFAAVDLPPPSKVALLLERISAAEQLVHLRISRALHRVATQQ